MKRILFICHGNICRSPTAEFIMKDLVCRAGLEAEYEIASAATHSDELGSGVYPPAARLLSAHGIDCSGKRARRMIKDDYEKYDLLIGMDQANLRDMGRLFGPDPAGKLHLLMEYAGRSGEAVADPWYTRDFQRSWQDISDGCQGLLEKCSGVLTLDFSSCRDKKSLYAVLRAKMDWQDWYGENLDALYDILTGLPHKGLRFVFIAPSPAAPEPVRAYFEKILRTFDEARK